MKITLEQVEALRKKIYCDYQTAEKALRKSKGKIDDAVLYLKKKKNSRSKKAFIEIELILNKILSYNLIVYKNEKILFNFPIFLIVLVIWVLNIPFPALFVILISVILCDYNFEIINKLEDDTFSFKKYMKRKDNNYYKKSNSDEEQKNYEEEINDNKENSIYNEKNNSSININRNFGETQIKNEDRFVDEDSKNIMEQELFTDSKKIKYDDDDDGFNEIIIE
ncbi:MAG: hypothetical protein ACOWWH_10490 [Eubacteriaceae bacterium]